MDKNHSSGSHFWQILSLSGGSARGNFGTNGHDAAVFLPSKDLKQFVTALQLKYDGQRGGIVSLLFSL